MLSSCALLHRFCPFFFLNLSPVSAQTLWKCVTTSLNYIYIYGIDLPLVSIDCSVSSLCGSYKHPKRYMVFYNRVICCSLSILCDVDKTVMIHKGTTVISLLVLRHQAHRIVSDLPVQFFLLYCGFFLSTDIIPKIDRTK